VKRYRLSPEAQADLNDIKLYLLKEGGARLARRVLSEIRKRLQFLAANPGAGHTREDLTDEPVKFWAIFSYLIVYDPATHPLGVARVLHGARDLETLFSDHPPRT
jgi:antitoxin ParD1/3/4/toxin ParE1/3/4